MKHRASIGALAMTALLAAATVVPAQTVVQVSPIVPATGLRWMGLGIEFDPYSIPPTAARWLVIEQRLDAIRPGFFRVMLDATDFCGGLDAAGKPQYAWQPAQSSNAKLQARWSEVQRVLAYAQSRGVRVLLGQWSPPAQLGILSPADPRWAQMQADLTAWLRNHEQDTVITDVILMNEPNGQWMWRHGAPDYTAWITGIRNLRRALDAQGLQQVAIAGPDNSGDTPWFTRAVQQDHALFGAWESHIYATDAEVLSGEILTGLRAQSLTLAHDDPAGSGKERFIAESGLQTGKNTKLDQQPRVHNFNYGVLMADYVAQVADAGWLGADAWDLDDAMHANGHGGLKIWGFWDSSTDAGLAPRPWYYAWSLLSHALPRGAVLEQVSGAPGSLRITAASRGTTGESVVLVNAGDTASTVRVADARLRGRVAERVYADSGHSAAGDRFTQGGGVHASAPGSLTVTVAAHSVTVLMSGEDMRQP